MTRAEMMSQTRQTVSKPKSSGRVSRKRSQSHSGAAGFGNGLASPHDRARVRDRNAAERSRVEQMFASGAPPTERRRALRGISASAAFEGRTIDSLPGQPQFNSQPPPQPRTALAARSALRAVPSNGCPVCTSQTIVTDDVMHAGMLRLSECLHCDYRWTERLSRNWSQLGARMARAHRPRIVATSGA